MRNIAIMANPIHQHPATGVVVPAPVLVNAGLDIWLHFGRPNPSFIIKLRRWLLDFETLIPAAELRKKINVSIQQATLDSFDFSEETVADDFTRAAIRRLRAPP